MEIRKKKRKIWPWIVGAVALALILAVLALVRRARLAAEAVAYETYTVKTGSVTSTITGSGRLASADELNIELPDGVKVADVFVSSGDSVKAGDALALFDADSLSESAAALVSQLAMLDAELSRMGSAKTVETILAPLAGRIKYLPVSAGDDVLGSISQYGALALLSTDGLMQIRIVSDDAPEPGTEVTVRWADGSDAGTVAQRTADGCLVTLDDDKAPCGVSAEVYDGEARVGEGTLEIHAPAAVLSNGGTISKVNCKLNDKVGLTTKLFTIDNGPFTASYQLKYAERQEVAEKLENVLRFIRAPRVLAPESGVVGTVNVIKGKETGASSSLSASSASGGSGMSTAFVLHTGGAVKMTVSVDEMDITSVSLGQDAAVTLDAFPGEKFAAKVTRISKLGETARSVASFAVELTLEADARLLQGMNGNATILVNQADDVLILPIAAISEDSSGAFVYVGDELAKTYITTGLSDGEYAAVTSGLSEGDVVKYAGAMTMMDMIYGFGGPFGNSSNRGRTANDGN